MLHLQEGEHIDLKARKHWFILAGDSLGVVIIYLLPFLAWEFLFGGGLSFFSSFSAESFGTIAPETFRGAATLSIDPALLLFLASAWTLFAWAWFFSIWTDYYLDIWIVTEHRIINIDQKGLFHREVSTLRTERIQDVTVEIAGIVATVLGFGNVHVQTAGEHAEFVIRGVSRPEHVKRRILSHIDTKTTLGTAI